jgi:hypothetical protein
MGLIKKIDVPKYFAARRAARLTAQLAAAPAVSQPDATGVAEIRPRGTSAKASNFVADFSLEHSSSGASPAPAK